MNRDRYRSVLTILVLIAVVLCLHVGTALAKELVCVSHTVQSGETLDSVAHKYITADREFKEFREGIYELNYEEVFKGRPPYEVHTGDLLQINYWKTNKEE